MFDKLRKAFAGTWNFEDGYIDQNGNPLFTTVARSMEEEKSSLIGSTLAKFANVAGRLFVNHTPTSKVAPHIYFEVETHELSSHRATVVSLMVNRPDGKQARFNFSLAFDKGEVKCTMTRMGASEAGDSQDTRRGVFVDWDRTTKLPSEFHAAKMERFANKENLVAVEIGELSKRFPDMKRLSILRTVFKNHIEINKTMLEAYNKA